MLKVRDGDLDKLGILFERYHKRLYRYFYRFTYRQQESEDLVQALFERLIKYRHTYTADDTFKSWIFSIARNLCRDHHRKVKAGREDIEEKIEMYPSTVTVGTDDQQQLKMLARALGQLDESQRELIILSRYEGFLYSEIAEIFGITEGAVKVKMYRAMNNLRKIINQISRSEV